MSFQEGDDALDALRGARGAGQASHVIVVDHGQSGPSRRCHDLAVGILGERGKPRRREWMSFTLTNRLRASGHAGSVPYLGMSLKCTFIYMGRDSNDFVGCVRFQHHPQ